MAVRTISLLALLVLCTANTVKREEGGDEDPSKYAVERRADEEEDAVYEARRADEEEDAVYEARRADAQGEDLDKRAWHYGHHYTKWSYYSVMGAPFLKDVKEDVTGLMNQGLPWIMAPGMVTQDWAWPRECLVRADGVAYRGFESYTVSGKPCRKWNDLEDMFGKHRERYGTKRFIDEFGTGDHNYCRNVGSSTKGIWCFIDGPKWDGKWDSSWDGKWEKCSKGRCWGKEKKPKLKWCELKKTRINNEMPMDWRFKLASLDVAKIMCETHALCTGIVKIDCRGDDRYKLVSGDTTSKDWRTSYTPCKTGKFNGVPNDYLHPAKPYDQDEDIVKREEGGDEDPSKYAVERRADEEEDAVYYEQD